MTERAARHQREEVAQVKAHLREAIEAFAANRGARTTLLRGECIAELAGGRP
jgi:hypothetical protein